MRLREAIRRIGHTFASSLDRPALLELALKTAVDAVQANGGRLTSRAAQEEPLNETAREGSLAGLEDALQQAERAALQDGGFGSRGPVPSASPQSRSGRSRPRAAPTG